MRSSAGRPGLDARRPAPDASLQQIDEAARSAVTMRGVSVW